MKNYYNYGIIQKKKKNLTIVQIISILIWEIKNKPEVV